MRKVILNVAVSIDMLIEGPNGEYDWCFDDGNDYGMIAFMNQIDAMFIGRKSYDLISSDKTSFKGIYKYVFSTEIKEVAEGEVLNLDWKTRVEEIVKSEGKDIWLFGGANLTKQFLDHNLVDELHLAVHPIVLGAGTPLFPSIKERKWFKLKETKAYDSGLVQLIYKK